MLGPCFGHIRQGWPKKPNPKKPAQKNPKKPSQKTPPNMGFFENCPKIIQKKAKNSIKPNKTPYNLVIRRVEIKDSSKGQKSKIVQNSFKKEKKPNKTQ